MKDRPSRPVEPQERPIVQKPATKDQSSLSDLRAVLAKISGESAPPAKNKETEKTGVENNEPKRTEAPPPQRSIAVTSAAPSRVDLKSALSAALATVPPPPNPPVVPDARAELLAMEQEVEAHLEQMGPTGSLPSAKTVERMMKGNDRGRSPFT